MQLAGKRTRATDTDHRPPSVAALASLTETERGGGGGWTR
jgi:hypothetical protein